MLVQMAFVLPLQVLFKLVLAISLSVLALPLGVVSLGGSQLGVR